MNDQPTDDPYYGGPLGAGIDWSDPNSPLAPYYFTTAAVVGAAILAVLMFIWSIWPLSHTDFWSHLRYGEWIVSHRGLPEREPLSPFTDPQRPFFDAMWLSQVLYHAAFRLGESVAGGDSYRRWEGGIEIVRGVHVLVAVVSLAMLGVAYRRRCDSAAWGVGGMAFVALQLLGMLAVQRPQSLAFVFYALILLQLSGKITLWRCGITVAAMILWANVHGSFIIGLLIILIIGIDALMQWRASLADAAARTTLLRLAITFPLCIVAVGVFNPYGPRLYEYILIFGNHPNLQTMVEWQPLEFRLGPGGHWSYLVTTLPVGVTIFWTRRGFSWGGWLLVGLFGTWPLLQQRMMIWWAPLVPWLIGPLWVRWWAERQARGVSAMKSPPASFRKTVLAIFIVGVGLLAAPLTAWAKLGRPRPLAQAVHPATPWDIAQALKGHAPTERAQKLLSRLGVTKEQPFRGVIFSSERLGEYLLWALPQERSPVMMFNHAQLFTPEYWQECLNVKYAEPGWHDILLKHDARLVIVEIGYQSELCRGLRQHAAWEVVIDEARLPKPWDAQLFVAVRRQ